MTKPELRIDFVANDAQLADVINRVQNRIENLAKLISELPDGAKGLSKLTREYTTQLNQLTRLTKAQQNFNQALNQTNTGSVVQNSKSARTALTSLSLVIQDLPFGFIGIQNNLPGVIQGFGNLTTTTNGKVLPALKQIGQALIGPAGLFLAFSAVTSGVTFLVQKYGSLSEAYDALIRGSKVLTKDQKEFAKGLAEEATDIVTLATLYPKFQNDREKQAEIIEKLNQLSPTYFGNLKAEKTSIDDVTQSLDKYINSFIGKIYIESQQKRINDLFTKYAEQITKIVDQEVTRKKNVKDTRKEIEGLTQTNDQLFKSVAESVKKNVPGDIKVGITPVVTKKTVQEAVDQLKGELKNQLTGVFGEIDVFKQFINLDDQFKTKEPAKVKEDVRDLKFEVKDLKDSFDYDSIIEQASKLGSIILDQQQKIKNGVVISQKYTNTFLERNAALKELQQIAPEVFGNLSLEKTGYEDLDDILFTYIRKLQIARDEIIARANASKLQAQADKNSADALQAQVDKFDKTIQKVNELNNLIGDPNKKSLKYLEEVTIPLQKLQKEFEYTKNVLQTLFFDPLTKLFENFFTTGKFTFEEFGKTVLQSVKKIAAQLIATQIIQNLAQLLSPGGFAASIGGANALPTILGRQQRGILQSFQGLGGFGTGNVAAPNIGSMTSGGLALSGGVSLVLRGSDLVGSINRTNAQINRVG
jgi:hypothetical protein